MDAVELGPVRVAWALADGDRRATAHLLLSTLIHDLGGPATPVIGRRCATCGAGDHGRPVALDAPFALSVSYAGAMVIAAVVRLADAASVGIDIEPADRDIGDLRLLFAPADPPDIAGWTRIEAVLKADGRGLRIAPSTVVLDGDRSVSPGPFDVTTIDGPRGYVVSVAVGSAAPRSPEREHR